MGFWVSGRRRGWRRRDEEEEIWIWIEKLQAFTFFLIFKL
jgi:hypothetical protein